MRARSCGLGALLVVASLGAGGARQRDRPVNLQLEFLADILDARLARAGLVLAS